MAISIQTLMVSNDLSKIDLEVSTSLGETVNKVLLWTQDTYRDPSLQIDLTSKLSQSSNTESIEILASDINESNLLGMYILQVESSDGSAIVVSTASFTQYYKMAAKLISEVDLSCLNCNNNFQNALLLDLYLQASVNSMILGRFQDAINNFKKIKIIESSSECAECFNLEPLVSSAGNIVSVGIIDCQLTTT